MCHGRFIYFKIFKNVYYKTRLATHEFEDKIGAMSQFGLLPSGKVGHNVHSPQPVRASSVQEPLHARQVIHLLKIYVFYVHLLQSATVKLTSNGRTIQRDGNLPRSGCNSHLSSNKRTHSMTSVSKFINWHQAPIKWIVPTIFLIREKMGDSKMTILA